MASVSEIGQRMVGEVLHISEKPWSAYTEADYSIEQWHSACLVHLHSGPPTSKSQCKLPVKTPNGALNRNGVHAAAAALAGARSPLQAPPEQKAKAARALRGYYSQLGEEPPDSLKQSVNMIENILSHFGTKGMKWGVRNKSSTSSGPSRRERRSDKKFTKKAGTLGTKIDIHNAIGKTWQKDLDSINTKYAKDIDNGTLLNTDHPRTKAYHKEIMDSYVKRLNEHAGTMTSKSGNLKYSVQRNDYDSLGFTVTTKEVKHADTDTFRVKFVKDDQGQIVGLEIDEMEQTTNLVTNILKHHGVKGMRWGVRRKATVGPQEVIVSDKRKKLKTKGGKGHPASEDAIRARTLGQVGKKSGLKALSNTELEAFNRRLNLEQNTKRLMYEDSSAPKKFVKTILRQTGSKTADEVSKDATSKIIKKTIRRAAVTAAAAA